MSTKRIGQVFAEGVGSVGRHMGSNAPQSESGRFIVFEGGDGTGKSTQAARLAEHLDAVLTREPGGTPLGARIRSIVLDPDHPELDDRTEAMLMAADRAQHVAELIRPTLASGRDVVSDRHVASSLAYQGVGRGLGVDAVASVNRFAVDELVPDLTILLELPAADAHERIGGSPDRIESAGVSLAELAAEAYRTFAEQSPGTWAVIDASGTIDEVASRVRAAVDERLGR